MSGAPVQGLVDDAGRLIAADPPLAVLQAAAGGTIGGVLAVPQLAALARLVKRLGIVVSRGVVAATDLRDLDLWVRAAPEGDRVRLSIAAWSEREVPSPTPLDQHARELDWTRAEGIWPWEVDAALRIVALPAQVAASLGAAASALAGQPLTRALALLPDARGTVPLIEALAEQRAFEGQAAELRSEPPVRLRLDGVPLRDAAGVMLGFRGTAVPETGVAIDGGADVAFGERLGEALRAPLDRIVRDAETIRTRAEGALRADYVGYAGDIASAGRHLLSLVGDLVDLSAIERPDFRPHQDKLDLAEVARRAAGLLAVRAASREIRIDRPAADEVVEVTADYGRTMQILVNLIGNAVRYSPAGGMVWLRTELREGEGLLIVADQGRGIAPGDQSRIFGKFERVDPAEAGGTGLGLYIARRLARAMGGEVTVESDLGQGARFTLALPIA